MNEPSAALAESRNTRNSRLSADDWWRIEISPASITRLRLAGHGAQLLGLNEVTD